MRLSKHQFWRWKAIDLLGGKCIQCGCVDKRCLQLDHKNGDGYKRNGQQQDDSGTRRKRWRRGLTDAEIRELVMDKPDVLQRDYQVLCANHHSIKTFEAKEQKGVRRNVRFPLFDGPEKPCRFVTIDWDAQARIDATASE